MHFHFYIPGNELFCGRFQSGNESDSSGVGLVTVESG